MRLTYRRLLVAVLVAVFEDVGLAGGGRSTDFPILNSMVDHVLGRHALHFVVFCG